nr:hypothetical protein [Tanacetum cinerariifolium]
MTEKGCRKLFSTLIQRRGWTYGVTNSGGNVGRLNNGGADVVAVTILKCYYWLANNILVLAFCIQGV